MFCRVIDGIPQSDLINIPLNDHRYPISGWQGLELRDRMLLAYDPQTDTVSATYTDPLIEDVKRQKKTELYATAAQKLDGLTAIYSSSEVSTFFLKEREASAYLESGNPVDAPWLEQEALFKKTTIESIANSVLSKSAQLRPATQQIIAKRGLLCDAVDAADTIAEVESIQWGS